MSDKHENNKLAPQPQIETTGFVRLSEKLKRSVEKALQNKKIVKFLNNTIDMVDYSIDFIIRDNSQLNRSEIVQVARKPILFGVWVSFITFIVCGIWGALAPINSAAIAQGLVVVESEKKIIQHLEGGIVKEINVKNGDIVKAGQPLIVLEDTRAKTALQSTLANLRTLKATEARLIAERDEAAEITFDKEILDDKDPTIDKVIDIQRRIFNARKEALNGRVEALKKRVEQQEKIVKSYEAQLNSSRAQLRYTNEQLEAVRQLVEKSQATKPRLLELQSKVAYYEGNIGEYIAKIAQANHSISEHEIELINIKTNFLNEIVKELKDVQTQISNYEEEVKARADTLNRTVITSPQNGRVNDLQIHTVGAVIAAQGGQKLMEIIPDNDKLVIDAQIRPEDIDLVHEGLVASVKLLAFKSRTTPSLDGLVTRVSAETIQSRYEGGRPYYQARIEIDEKQFEAKKLKNLKLYPGMPAQIFIVTGSRTLLKYILDPVIDSIRKSFRER
ncbi:MAG: HlyD family type I secretion periplasmic adaptor subunit [Alphaproteobacteria bacterium]